MSAAVRTSTAGRRRPHRAAPVAALALWSLVAAGPVRGELVLDGEEDLPFDAPESWAMQYFASVASFTGLGVAERAPAWRIEVGLEAGHVPELSAAERRVGFGGTKIEDLNKSEVFGRPRVLVTLPANWSLDLSYLPPIELSGVEPELVGLAVARPLWERGRGRLGLRLAGQYGTFEGDFTCSADEIENGPNPFACEAASQDVLTARAVSLEISGARRLGREARWEGHAALIAAGMNLDFQVRARYAGLIDRTRLHTDGETLALAAGLGYRATESWRLAAELFWSPLEIVRPPATSAVREDLLNLRVGLHYRVR